MSRLPAALPAATSVGWQVIIQPLARDGAGNLTQAPTVLPAPEHTDIDISTGNVAWTFSRRVPALDALLARNVQQQRTRSGTYAVIADAGAVLIQATFRSGTNGEPQPQQLATGVVSLAGVGSGPGTYSQTLTLTRCDVLYTRDGQRQQP